MTHYIATFYSQYDAVQFLKQTRGRNISCRLAPVPRSLSSSCGTCAHYSHDGWDIGFVSKDLETVYEKTEHGFETVFINEDIH